MRRVEVYNDDHIDDVNDNNDDDDKIPQTKKFTKFSLILNNIIIYSFMIYHIKFIIIHHYL
jgi:hypothetical protein